MVDYSNSYATAQVVRPHTRMSSADLAMLSRMNVDNPGMYSQFNSGDSALRQSLLSQYQGFLQQQDQRRHAAVDAGYPTISTGYLYGVPNQTLADQAGNPYNSGTGATSGGTTTGTGGTGGAPQPGQTPPPYVPPSNNSYGGSTTGVAPPPGGYPPGVTPQGGQTTPATPGGVGTPGGSGAPGSNLRGSTLGVGPMFPPPVPAGTPAAGAPGSESLMAAYQKYMQGGGADLPLFHYQPGSPAMPSWNASAMLQAQRMANGYNPMQPIQPYGGRPGQPQPVAPGQGSFATNPNLNTTLLQSGLMG